MITAEMMLHWFTYHQPKHGDIPKYEAIREAGRVFATAIVQNTPPCADQTVAVRRVREAIMIANAAISCEGR